MAEQWGPWIEHDGKGCPISGQRAQWVWADGTLRDGFANSSRVNFATGEVIGPANGSPCNSWRWPSMPKRNWGCRVIRYRVRQFSALTDLKAICENPQPVREDA